MISQRVTGLQKKQGGLGGHRGPREGTGNIKKGVGVGLGEQVRFEQSLEEVGERKDQGRQL